MIRRRKFKRQCMTNGHRIQVENPSRLSGLQLFDLTGRNLLLIDHDAAQYRVTRRLKFKSRRAVSLHLKRQLMS